MILIGLSGYARSGKDTVGQILCEEHGFTRVSFADKLREVALAIDPIVECQACIVDNFAVTNEIRLSSYVESGGWEKAKQNPEVRRLLQVIGTDAGRDILGANIWVDAAMKGLEHDGRYVFTDVRFPNEYEAIAHYPDVIDSSVPFFRGRVWRIVRPGTDPISPHRSETALDSFSFDSHLDNDGTIADLKVAVAWKLIPIIGGIPA